jgi:hypothetical protein
VVDLVNQGEGQEEYLVENSRVKYQGGLFDAEINSRAHTCNHSNILGYSINEASTSSLKRSTLNAYGEF